MARLRKWLQYTPWKRGSVFVNRYKVRYISETEMLFGLLVWIGMPRAYAWGLAFPESKANPVSVSQLASRLMESYGMRKFFNFLSECEKSMQFRYPKDMEDSKHYW